MIFTYTEDLPYEDPEENKRGFYKLPRSILLPPYLAHNPYFVEFCDAIDEVFDDPIESKIFALQNIRNVWATNKHTEELIKEERMLDFSDWGGVDHATGVQQVNNLGLRIATAAAVDNLSYRALAKFVGAYWFGKGKNTAIDFLNFCLGTRLTITPLWTQDYVTFHPYPGDSATFIFDTARRPSTDYYPVQVHSKVGGADTSGYKNGVGWTLQQYLVPATPVEPPAWYPTTHVNINVPAGTKVSAEVIGALFYEIANYNLVINKIQAEAQALPIISEGDTQANIMGIGHIQNTLQTPATEFHPIAYHNKVGGRTGGTGGTLRKISTVTW